MSKVSFYELNDQEREVVLGQHPEIKAKFIKKTEGLSGDIYIFDQGERISPRYVCAKVPKLIGESMERESAIRFVNELKIQLLFYRHTFVHWVFDFTEVFGVPVALSRYWGADLTSLIGNRNASEICRLSVMVYVCAGLRHCYKAGLVSHQDLKPANIFLEDLAGRLTGRRDLDIYTVARVADFGMANASIDSNRFGGSRPYMAPEQLMKSPLSPKTDVFALGVILCELITQGYHPNGIYLSDVWPEPDEVIRSKWTRSRSWKQWSFKKDKVDSAIASRIDTDILELINKMLSTVASDRPCIDDVMEILLSLIKERCLESYSQIEYVVKHYDNEASSESLEEQWLKLNSSWKIFEAKFGCCN